MTEGTHHPKQSAGSDWRPGRLSSAQSCLAGYSSLLSIASQGGRLQKVLPADDEREGEQHENQCPAHRHSIYQARPA